MTPRRAGVAAGLALVAVLAWIVASAAAGERPAALGHMAATGAVRLAAGDGSAALLHAEGLLPGQSVSGTISLSNVGETGGELSLLRTGLTDVPGRGGARLSRALVLDVTELGATPRAAYRGPLADEPTLDLGALGAGASRRYRLTLTLPDTGRPAGPFAGDNALMGAGTTIDWLWGVEAAAAPSATPGAPGPAPTPAPQLPVVVGGGAPRLELRIPHQRVLATRGIALFGTCDEPCRVTFRARIETAPLAHSALRQALQRRGVFRSRGADRRLPIGVERRIALRLTRRAVRTLRRGLHRRGRVAVVVSARVRGAGGAQTVTRRIVLRRAPRTHPVRG